MDTQRLHINARSCVAARTECCRGCRGCTRCLWPPLRPCRQALADRSAGSLAKRTFAHSVRAPRRELTHYRGEPDPFKGDVANQRVREQAQEALEAIFAATDVSRPPAAAPLQARRAAALFAALALDAARSGMGHGGVC